MAQLLVRDIPDEVVTGLKARAAANGRSAEAEHRAILKAAIQPEPVRDFWAEADRLAKATAGRHHTPSEILLREDRDTRR